MKLRIILYTLAVYLACTFAVAAQDPTPVPTPLTADEIHRRNQPVTVDQGFLDDATKAFSMVVALRDQVQKQVELNAAKGVTNAALTAQLTALNGLIAIFEKKDSVYQSLLDLRDQAFAIYEKVIKMQADMMDRMWKQLNKGKSGWDTFLNGVKQIITFATGVLVGKKLVGL